MNYQRIVQLGQGLYADANLSLVESLKMLNTIEGNLHLLTKKYKSVLEANRQGPVNPY